MYSLGSISLIVSKKKALQLLPQVHMFIGSGHDEWWAAITLKGYHIRPIRVRFDLVLQSNFGVNISTTKNGLFVYSANKTCFYYIC